MFMNTLASKHCKNETLHSLQNNYTLPGFLKLKEYVEIMDAYESAINKDEEIKAKQPKK